MVALADAGNVHVAPITATIEEGGTDSFSMSLAEPIIGVEGDATVDVVLSVDAEYESVVQFSSDDLRYADGTFTFSTDDWFVAANFDVTILDDPYLNDFETIEVTYTASSDSPFYDGRVDTFEITVTDDETDVYPALENVLPLDDAEFNTDELTFSGETVAGFEVQILNEDDEALATAVADGSGDFEVEAELEEGEFAYTVQADAGEDVAFLLNDDLIDVVSLETEEVIYTIDTDGAFTFSDLVYDDTRNMVYALGVNTELDSNMVVYINAYTYAIVETGLQNPDNSLGTFGLDMDADGDYLYVTDYTDVGLFLNRIDLDTGAVDLKVDVTLDVDLPVSGVAVNSSTNTVWVRTLSGLEIFDADTLDHQDSLELGGDVGNGNIVFNADQTVAYVGDFADDAVYIIDTTDYSFTVVAGVAAPNNVALAEQAEKLFVSSDTGPSIYTIDLSTNTLVDTEAIDEAPLVIGVNPDGDRWITATDTDDIYFGSVATNAVEGTYTNPTASEYVGYNSKFVTDYRVSETLTLTVDLPNSSSGGSRMNSVKNLSYEDEIKQAIEYNILTDDPEAESNKCNTLVMMAKVFDWPVGAEVEQATYTDVPEWCSWYANFATARGVIEGRSPELLGMDTPMQRYEVAVMLVRELRVLEYEFSGELVVNFVDALVPWAEKEVMQLAQEGIIKGFADGSFGGEKSIVNQDVAVMLLRLNDII